MNVLERIATKNSTAWAGDWQNVQEEVLLDELIGQAPKCQVLKGIYSSKQV
jgi:hypothetical protein